MDEEEKQRKAAAEASAAATARAQLRRQQNANPLRPFNNRKAAPKTKQPQNPAMSGGQPRTFAHNLALPGKKLGEGLPIPGPGVTLPPGEPKPDGEQADETQPVSELLQQIEPVSEQIEQTLTSIKQTLPVGELAQTEQQKDVESLQRLAKQVRDLEAKNEWYYDVCVDKDQRLAKWKDDYESLRNEAKETEKDLRKQIQTWQFSEQSMRHGHAMESREIHNGYRNRIHSAETNQKAAESELKLKEQNFNDKIAELRQQKDKEISNLKTEVERVSDLEALVAAFQSGEIQKLEHAPEWVKQLQQENEDLRAACEEFETAAKENDQMLEVPALDLGPQGTIRKIAKMKKRLNKGVTSESSENELSRQHSQTSERSQEERPPHQSLLDEMGGVSADESGSEEVDEDTEEDAKKVQLSTKDAIGQAKKCDEEEDADRTLTNIDDTTAQVQKDDSEKQTLSFSGLMGVVETLPEEPSASSDPRIALAIQRLDEVLIPSIPDAQPDYFKVRPAEERAKRVQHLIADRDRLRTKEHGKSMESKGHERDARKAKEELEALQEANKERDRKERYGEVSKRAKGKEIGLQTPAEWAAGIVAVPTGEQAFGPSIRDPTVKEVLATVSWIYFIPLIILLPLLFVFISQASEAKQFWLSANDMTLSTLLDIQASSDGSFYSNILKPVAFFFIWLENHLDMHTTLLG